MAPLLTGQISPPSGSQTITASTSAASGSAANALAPSIIPSSSASTPTTIRPAKPPSSTARAAWHHRRDAALHVRGAATAEPTVDDIAGERVERPARRVPGGHHVAVSFEHQRPAGAVAVDHRDHVGSAGRDLGDLARASRTVASVAATRSAAGCSLRPVAGSFTVGSRTSCRVSSTTASLVQVRQPAIRVGHSSDPAVPADPCARCPAAGSSRRCARSPARSRPPASVGTAASSSAVYGCCGWS